jgi:CDP-diacylglycerol--glycerol-3-phosphate 3-phosphatidyltransferase
VSARAAVPLLLTAARALLAPVVVLLAWFDPDRAAFGACLVLAFLSDVFDGIVARRLGVATPGLRRLDSLADTLFYAAAVCAAWRLYPAVIADHAAALLTLAALEIARYAFDLAKFRREASYHMWSSKLWGIVLFVGFFALLALGRSGPEVALAIYVGIVADVEGLAISVVLRRWEPDVPTLVHALRRRRMARP